MQFNARSETVAEKNVFKKLLSRQRCVVLLNGFYEWKKVCSRVLCHLVLSLLCEQKRLQKQGVTIFDDMYYCRRVSRSSLTSSTSRAAKQCAWQVYLTSGMLPGISPCIPSPSSPLIPVRSCNGAHLLRRASRLCNPQARTVVLTSKSH